MTDTLHTAGVSFYSCAGALLWWSRLRVLPQDHDSGSRATPGRFNHAIKVCEREDPDKAGTLVTRLGDLQTANNPIGKK